MRNLKVFSGSSHPELTEHICEKLGIPVAPSVQNKFSNQETSVKIVRNEDVFIIQSGSKHINDHLMELLIMISACKGASASRVTVAGVDHIITMDLHSSQMQGFFNKPVDNLYAEPLIVKWIQDSVCDFTNGVVVSKNAGGVKRVTSLADRLKIDFALIHADRTRGSNNTHCDSAGENSNTFTNNNHHATAAIINKASDENDIEEGYPSRSASTAVADEAPFVNDTEPDSVTITLVGDVAGKDDMIDKAGSFIDASEHLVKKCGAKRVYVIATHGILNNDCLGEIERCKSIYKLVITNTFPISPEDRRKSTKLVIIDASVIIAEAIRRIHNGEISKELAELFTNAVLHGNMRIIRVSIVNGKLSSFLREQKFMLIQRCIDLLESLIPNGTQTVINSWDSDFDEVKKFLDEKIPCYILYRLDSRSSSGDYEWLFLAYVPDESKVRDKMIYASTRATLTKELGDYRFVDSMYGNKIDEFTLEGYHKHKQHQQAEAPLTQREKELAEVRSAEANENSFSSSARRSHAAGVSFPLSDEAIEAIKSLSQTEKLHNFVKLSLDITNERVELSSTDKIEIDDLANSLPSDAPCFSFFAYDHNYKGDDFHSI
ncbi:4421_t:CDS:10, partial [Acaulospora colombiana]